VATLNLNTTALVDLIGEMKARIAPTLKQLKTLEDKLKAEGPGRYAGLHYEANVFVSEREKLDMDAVRAKLSAQFLRANTSLTSVTTLKVTARQLGDDSLREAA